MKKIISLLFAVVFVCGVLVGCSEQNLKVETLGVIFEDGKTITMDMDKEAMIKVMGEPSSSAEDDNYGFITWTGDTYTMADFKNSETLSLYMSDVSCSAITTFGISCGDSLALVKDKLGKPMYNKEGEKYLYYAFQRIEGRYEQVSSTHDSWENFYSEIEKTGSLGNYYIVLLGIKDDKVDTCTIDSFRR